MTFESKDLANMAFGVFLLAFFKQKRFPLYVKKPDYAAPEIWELFAKEKEKKKLYNQQSDTYSLGITFLRCLGAKKSIFFKHQVDEKFVIIFMKDDLKNIRIEARD